MYWLFDYKSYQTVQLSCNLSTLILFCTFIFQLLNWLFNLVSHWIGIFIGWLYFLSFFFVIFYRRLFSAMSVQREFLGLSRQLNNASITLFYIFIKLHLSMFKEGTLKKKQEKCKKFPEDDPFIELYFFLGSLLSRIMLLRLAHFTRHRRIP